MVTKQTNKVFLVVSILIFCLLAGGCPLIYSVKVPLTSSPTRKIDKNLLGAWYEKSTNKEYSMHKLDDWHYLLSRNEMVFIMYHSDIDTTSLISSFFSYGEGYYLYQKPELRDGGKTLDIKQVDLGIVDRETATTTQSAQQQLKNRLGKEDIFTSEPLFEFTKIKFISDSPLIGKSWNFKAFYYLNLGLFGGSTSERNVYLEFFQDGRVKLTKESATILDMVGNDPDNGTYNIKGNKVTIDLPDYTIDAEVRGDSLTGTMKDKKGGDPAEFKAHGKPINKSDTNSYSKAKLNSENVILGVCEGQFTAAADSQICKGKIGYVRLLKNREVGYTVGFSEEKTGSWTLNDNSFAISLKQAEIKGLVQGDRIIGTKTENGKKTQWIAYELAKETRDESSQPLKTGSTQSLSKFVGTWFGDGSNKKGFDNTDEILKIREDGTFRFTRKDGTFTGQIVTASGNQFILRYSSGEESKIIMENSLLKVSSNKTPGLEYYFIRE